MNIHGARRAGRRRRKASMGWSWAAACGVQGRGAYRAASRTAFYSPNAIFYDKWLLKFDKWCFARILCHPLERTHGLELFLSYNRQGSQLMLTNRTTRLEVSLSHRTWRRYVRHMVSYSCAIVTFSVKHRFCDIRHDLETGVRITKGHRNRHGSIRRLWLPINSS